MNKHLYIPYTSFHPRSALSGYIFGEAQRIIINSSSRGNALVAVERFAGRLRQRGYPLDIIIKQLSKAKYSSRSLYIDSNVVIKSDTRVSPLVLPYRPEFRYLNLNQLFSEHLPPLDYPHLAPIVSWSNCSNLQALLKLHWPK